MKITVLSLVIALLATASAKSATVTLDSLVVAQTLPTLVNACASPNIPARADEVFFATPTIAAEQGVSGTSVVKIDLNAHGNLVAQSLFSSSGNRLLDNAALQSARMSRYTSETRNCEYVAGTYLYTVEY